ATPIVILWYGGSSLSSFQSACVVSSTSEINQKLSSSAEDKRWAPPSPGELKLSTDSSVSTVLSHSGLEAIIRDSAGHVLSILAIHHHRVASLLQAELLAICEGLMFAASLGVSVTVLESDSRLAIQAINSGAIHSLERFIVIVDDIIKLLTMVKGGTCCYVPRQMNKQPNLVWVL
ncbi:Ribonuclease H-like domain containing protein, partial [Parasponia andersonii]